ncbi:MAG: ferredoxin [Gemmatimonas sp.]|nr:ferredoxin [Gemmatimonas sp.]
MGLVKYEERTFAGLTVRIDRTLCVGFGDCLEAMEELFELDEEGIATFRDAMVVDSDRLVEACRACPVDALEVTDSDGRKLAP